MKTPPMKYGEWAKTVGINYMSRETQKDWLKILEEEWASNEELFRCYTCGQNRIKQHQCINQVPISNEEAENFDSLFQKYKHRFDETDKKY